MKDDAASLAWDLAFFQKKRNIHQEIHDNGIKENGKNPKLMKSPDTYRLGKQKLILRSTAFVKGVCNNYM